MVLITIYKVCLTPKDLWVCLMADRNAGKLIS